MPVQKNDWYRLTYLEKTMYYQAPNFIDATSTQETFVLAYPTLNENSDSMTIFLVNRHTSQTKEIQLDVRNFIIKNEPIYLYTLSKLPSAETFISHMQNALKKKQIDNLFNSNGQKLKTISESQTFSGKNHIESDLSNFPTGIYWITVRTDSVTETRKFIVN